ncbi:MAG: 16S rRNA processing protein RimM [Gammaproteobacteria bacterium]|nr:16S rRNA processing protein RimM [Gammaproteobacteria bacterium]
MAWVELGRLGRPYGVRGWLHVVSHTEPPERLLEYPQWSLELASGARVTRRPLEGRAHGRGLVARLDGVADRDAAQALTGARVLAERSALPAPAANEYYRADLVGCEVVNLEGQPLGTVSHFVDAPAGTVMVVKGGAGEHWVLADRAHLRGVDLAGRRVVVDWPAEL